MDVPVPFRPAAFGPPPAQKLLQGLPLYQIPGRWNGLVKPGNIDLNNRPPVRNPDGSVSTVLSVVEADGRHEVLVPQVVNGHVVTPQQAWNNYLKTGQHLGMFTNPQMANTYAEALHREQAKMVGR